MMKLWHTFEYLNFLFGIVEIVSAAIDEHITTQIICLGRQDSGSHLDNVAVLLAHSYSRDASSVNLTLWTQQANLKSNIEIIYL